MSKGRYIPDHSKSTGMGGYLLHDAGLQEALVKVAEEGAAYARSIAPVDSGDYVDSFSVTRESFRKDSVGATIINDAPHAAKVEFELTHTLAKTADHLNAKP